MNEYNFSIKATVSVGYDKEEVTLDIPVKAESVYDATIKLEQAITKLLKEGKQ